MGYVRKIGGGGGNRTRVRESSANGSTCLAQPIIFNLPVPDGQGDRSAIPNWVLANQVRTPVTAIPCDLTPEIHHPQANGGQRLAGLSGESVVVVVGNYSFADGFTRYPAPRHAPQVLQPTSKPSRPLCVRLVSIGRGKFPGKLMLLEQPLLLPLPVTILLGRSLVMQLLAFGESNLQLRAPARPVHGGRDQGVARALRKADQPV